MSSKSTPQWRSRKAASPEPETAVEQPEAVVSKRKGPQDNKLGKYVKAKTRSGLCS